MHSIYSIYDATTEDWAAILGLAHYWQFGEVKSLVVRELEKQIIPSIYKIVIYHRYNVDRGLLLPSYTDLVSREQTLSIEEATDLGLETSLMIMTAREIVRKGDAPTSTPRISPEELRIIIRQVFRFPLLRSDSPLSDATAAETGLDIRSPPYLSEKTDLPTVPEHENETANPFTTSASLNSSFQSVNKTPIISAPIPPAPPLPSKKQEQSKSTSTQNKQEANPTTVSPPKADTKSKEEPPKPTSPPKQENELKPKIPEQPQLIIEEKTKPEIQDNKKKSFQSRLAEAGKDPASSTAAKDAVNLKDKDGDKSTDNKGAKDAKDTSLKEVPGPLQDPNATPNGTPLLNQDPEPGTPTTGQSVVIHYYAKH